MKHIYANRDCLGLEPIPMVVVPEVPVVRCPHCGGSGRLYIGDDIQDCGVCCENGYITEAELKEYEQK